MKVDGRHFRSIWLEPDGWTVGGMAKGAGMLAPGLATMRWRPSGRGSHMT